MAQEKLVNYVGLEEQLGIPVRTLRTLVQRRAIPCLRVGRRTVLFLPSKVISALEHFEVQEVSSRTRGK